MIKWILSRATCLEVDVIILATTCSHEDDPLVRYAQSLQIDKLEIVRGNATDLVDRTIKCLDAESVDVFARINGDSPFFPVSEINLAFETVAKNPACKFVTNLLERSYPYGVAVEVVTSEYYRGHSVDVPQDALEHTTQHLYKLNASEIVSVELEANLTDVSLTVDTFEGYHALNDLIIAKGLDFLSEWTEAL